MTSFRVCNFVIGCFLFVLLMFVNFTYAGANHTDGLPPAMPPESVVGRWLGNASFVVVAPDWVLTTRHQGGSPATLTINGDVYNCTYNSQWEGGGVNADIRLIRLTKLDGSKPNLTHTPLYSGTTEKGQEVVIGGYGLAKDSPLLNPDSIQYGYYLKSSEGNTTSEWYCNQIEGISQKYDSYGRVSEVLYCYFDGPDSNKALEHEGMPTLYDSGGGWFLETAQGWQLVALSRSIEYHNTYELCWFKNPTTLRDDPDFFDGVRVSTYADWANAIIQQNETFNADFTNDYCVDVEDLCVLCCNWLKDSSLENNWCDGCDLNTDGLVDLLDFVEFIQDWNCIIQ